MRKLKLTLAAVAAVLATGMLANRADAVTAGNPAGIRAALDDVAVIDQVHCRWGRLHHNWWNGRPHSDGCYHGGRVIAGPRLFIAPRLHSGRVLHFRSGGNFRGGAHFRSGGRHRR